MAFMGSSSGGREKKGACTWPLAIAFLLSLGATIILTLSLGPVEKGVSAALAKSLNFEPHGIGNDDGYAEFIESLPPTVSPVEGGSSPPRYDAMRCAIQRGSGECCNGLESNCDLRVDEMAFAVVHNAMSTEESGFNLGYNHVKNLDGALDVGFRGVNLDVCKCDNDGGDGSSLRFCHSVCGFGDRDPAQVFLEIMSFLTREVTEVVVLIFQFSTGDPTLADLFDVMMDVTGFVDLMYVHPRDEEMSWPKMGEMVAEKKRILAFYHDAKDDCSADADACPEELHDYFSYVADTDYRFDDVEAIESWESSCKVNRGKGGTKEFYNVNNFVSAPNQEVSRQINEKGFVSDRVEQCLDVSGLVPNFITVDFWGEGDLPEVVQNLNMARAAESEGQALGDL